MNRKNDFYYLLFTDTNGAAEVRNDKLLASFDSTRNYFLMDYAEPRAAFTGEIVVKICSVKELKGAVAAYEKFKNFNYPPGYIENIERALILGEQADGHKVELYA